MSSRAVTRRRLSAVLVGAAASAGAGLLRAEVKERYADLGIEAQASSPAELRKRLVADIAKWAAVIERAGIAKQ